MYLRKDFLIKNYMFGGLVEKVFESSQTFHLELHHIILKVELFFFLYMLM